MYLLLVSLVAPIVGAFGNESESMPVASISEASAFDLRDKWVRNHLSNHEKVPFSFFYDGVESSQMISDWIFHSEEVEVDDKLGDGVATCMVYRSLPLAHVKIRTGISAEFSSVI